MSWTPEGTHELITLWNQMVPVPEMAKHFQKSISAVKKRAHRIGLPRRKHVKRDAVTGEPLPPQETERQRSIRQLAVEGLTRKQIAERLGIPYKAVSWTVVRLRIKVAAVPIFRPSREEFAALVNKGWSDGAVGMEYKRSGNWARKVRLEYGLESKARRRIPWNDRTERQKELAKRMNLVGTPGNFVLRGTPSLHGLSDECLAWVNAGNPIKRYEAVLSAAPVGVPARPQYVQHSRARVAA